MKITLRLSESLLSIYRETANPLNEVMVINLEEPTTLHSIIIKAGINPSLTPMIIINNKRISSLNLLIDNDEIITLIGPLAGG
ncbi:MAG: hypothetical protein K0Q97_485 [Bacillota bacterium]|jgi:hypothetical protein|nr:hypothetical protein [Bacillota bacterium]